MTQISKENALKCLKRALEEVPQMKGRERRDPEFQTWKTSTLQDLKRIFGTESDCSRNFDRSLILGYGEVWGTNVDRSAALLSSWIEEVEEDWLEAAQASVGPNTGLGMRSTSNKVFVVHGHDEATREKVAGLLRQLDLDPIILHERPSRGRTIIEKVEDNADVGFAVVLLTRDDVGAPENERDGLKPRARQNVILELGFFICKLGREKVCTLKKSGVETPSDYDGVVYTELDDGGAWRSELVRELNGDYVGKCRSATVSPCAAGAARS